MADAYKLMLENFVYIFTIPYLQKGGENGRKEFRLLNVKRKCLERDYTNCSLWFVSEEYLFLNIVRLTRDDLHLLITKLQKKNKRLSDSYDTACCTPILDHESEYVHMDKMK